MGFNTKRAVAALAAGALAGFASLAAAQPVIPPPASPPLAEAPVDPEQLALARRLISLMSDQMNFQAIWKDMTDQMLQIGAANADPAVKNRLMTALDQAEAKVLPELIDEVAKIYARHLTAKEMEDSIAFYQTASGQAVLHKMPEITADMGPAIARLAPRMRDAIIEALCANGACTPEQRKAMGNRTAS